MLVSATAPIWANAVNDGGADDLHSVVDGNGMPNNYPLYISPLGGNVKDLNLTASCSPGPGRLPTPSFATCGDYAVNTTQPFYQPYSPGTAVTRRLPPLTNPTIGDRLDDGKVDWAWYSGGWSNADGDVNAPGWTNGTGPTCTDPNHLATAVYPNCADGDFQFHHQAFNYYADLAPGHTGAAAAPQGRGRVHEPGHGLDQDLQPQAGQLHQAARREQRASGLRERVAWERPPRQPAQGHRGSACAKDTMVIVTYDEFGGQWDHVAPPGTVGGVPGPHDKWGPGTRIPALVVSPLLKGDFVVDHVEHDTTSILTTIEKRWNLQPLGTRDKSVASLATAFDAKKPAGL